MPQTCSVPYCRGNYKTGPKVNVFQFPKDEALKKKWVAAIRREGFTPTKNSRVCELHFRPEEIRREISHLDEKSGKHLVAKMTYPRLCEGVIPSQLPNSPSHRSGPLHLREGPDQNIDGIKSLGTISNMPSISAGTSKCISAAVTSPGASSMHSIGHELLFDDEEDVEVDIKEEVVDDGSYIDMDFISKTESTLQSSEEPNIFATFDDKEKEPSLSCTSSTLVSDPLAIKESTRIKSEDHDEYHLFGMFVASQLRALSQRDALQAQVEIQTILHQKRLNSIT